MQCTRFSGWFAWLVILSIACIWWAPSVTIAQEPLHAAGLVIDYGDGRVSYAWVPFVEDSITGIDLLKRSGLSLVSVPFGGLGEGVCSIEGTGCGIANCRSRLCQTGDRASPFWQYMRQDAPGQWKPFALGASQSTVEDGDIDGWAWIGTPPELPAISMPHIEARVGLDAARPTADGDLQPLIITTGDRANNPVDQEWRDALPGAGILAVVVGAGSFAIWRSRRRRVTSRRALP